MKRIGISARLDTVLGRDEQRDALDVRWPSLLWDLGYMPLLLSSGLADVPAYLQALNLDGFILSGGNDVGSAPNRDRLEKGILNYSASRGLPVLGVCRGMQFINDYCGGSLVAVSGHVATRHKLAGEWAKTNGFLDVNSYHNQAIVAKTLSQMLVILATVEGGAIEALRHKTLPWLGIMWHPEREETPAKNDLALIKKHLGSEAA
jgi:putative glutamine amidotransferase